MKLAMLGGSFDPVHLGHLNLAHLVLSSTNVQNLAMVPAWVSNFKQESLAQAGAEDRLKLLELALLDYSDIYGRQEASRIFISDVEIRRKGISYTYDTVIQLKREHGITDRLGLVMGDDLVGRLAQWHRFEDLCQEVRFLIFRRMETRPLVKVSYPGFVYECIDNPIMVQSATAVRQGRLEGLSPRALAYVEEKGLYGDR